MKKARKDPTTGKKTMEIEGEWRIGKTGPQFESKIKTEKEGEIIGKLGNGSTYRRKHGKPE